MPQPVSGTDPAWRRILPLTDASQATRRLLALAVQYAKHAWIIPVVVPPEERLELRSLFLRTVEEDNRSNSIHIVRDRCPKADELECEDGVSLLFLKGERLPRYVQWAILNNRLNFPVTMLAIESTDPLERRSTTWSQAFLEACAPLPLIWPAWKDRDVDERRLVVERVRSSLSMPLGRPVPEFDRQVMDYLVKTQFVGTLAMEREAKAALQRYIQRGSTGPLTVKHIRAFDGLKQVGSHTDVPPLTLVR